MSAITFTNDICESFVNANENITVSNNYKNNIINIIEVSNIYPTNLIKHNLHASERKHISNIRELACYVCCGKVPSEYIRWSFNDFKYGYIYTLDKHISAFCIWKINNNMSLKTLERYKEMYIHLICGIKFEYKLIPRIFDDIIHYCRKNSIRYITLKAANDKLKEYYIKNGFEENVDVSRDEIIQFDVSKSRITYPETRTAPGQTRRQNRTRRQP